MNYGMNFGLFGTNKGGISYSNCLKPLEQLTNGWYGYDYDQSPTGILEPVYTSGGMFIYSFKFDIVSGDWIVQFGDDGYDPLPNSINGVIQFDLGDVDNILLVWSEANLRYEGNDVDAAVNVATYVGTEICFAGAFVPRELIHYDFAELKVKGVTYTPPAPPPIWTFTVSQSPTLYWFNTTSDEGLWINDVFYSGHDDENQVEITSTGTITFQESKSNVLTVFETEVESHLSGTLPDINNNTKLEVFAISGGDSITGNIPDLSNNISLEYYYCESNQLTGFDGGSIIVSFVFMASDNLLTESAVDAILTGFVAGGGTNTEIALENGNAAPSAAGEANVDILRSRGCTVTVTGSY